ncbi:MAG TPA: HEAT repeat domain-containing protein, partial [Chthoniobacteraceae bacterium]
MPPRLVLAVFLTLSSSALAAEISAGGPAAQGLKPHPRVPEPKVQAASDESEKTLLKFKVDPAFKVTTWAAEPMLGNPVAFTLDDQGNIFTAETYRYRSSVLDIRHYMFMLEDDLAARTTDDRIAFIKKNFPNDWQQLGIETEVVRRLTDANGDGKADTSTVYAAGMNTLLDGINSGVLAYDGKVWCTNMPNLWQFSGLTADGAAAKRESLSSGYGVRFSFTGHDMHGLQIGPDGRLYFSFGDRGAHVVTKEGKTLAFPDEGAVFRCELDGSHLEVVHRGLRNPQELAFDQHGNLFTGDNDSDQGDRERWVYIVPGGDSGWRVGWQHNPLGKENNPWLAEKMWEPRTETTPYHILSPIINIPDGPSGITHYPGTGLPTQFDGMFFVCGFKGSSARSSISMLKVKQDGADFTIEHEPAVFIGDVQATDVDFGPDSRVYFSEWGEGWEGTGRGRIYKLEHTAAQQEQAAQIAEVKKLLGEGFKQRPVAELARLIGHKDQRIRLRAQWALASLPGGAEAFLTVAMKGTDRIARLHGMWGFAQAARLAGHKDAASAPAALQPLVALLADTDAEIRAQAAHVIGDTLGSIFGDKAPQQVAPLVGALLPLLRDQEPRVQFFAAQSLAKLRAPEAAGPAIAMLRTNQDKDQNVRHAAVMALARTGDITALTAAAADTDRSVRLGALLALARLDRPEVAQFLADKDPLLVKEAARLINDVPIAAALPQLAARLDQPLADTQFMLRVINANFRAGTPEAAQRLAKFAATAEAAELLRVEALKALASWAKPFPRDRVAGVYRPLPDRSAAPAVAALEKIVPQLLTSSSPNLVIQAVDAISVLGVKQASPALIELIGNSKVAADVRGKALETLATFNDPGLAAAVKQAMADVDPGLRVTAISMLGRLNPDEAAEQLGRAFAASEVREKKAILTALGKLKSAGADKIISPLLDGLIAGKIAPEAQLELIEAAGERNSDELKAKLVRYEQSLPQGDPLARFTA